MKHLALVLTAFISLLAGSSREVGAEEDALYVRLRPAAYWSFNRCGLDVERQSRLVTIRDSSWCGIDLALHGGRCTQKGRHGRGAQFDGLDDLAETTGEIRNPFERERCTSALDFGGELTVSAWVFPERLAGSQTIVRKGNTPASFGLFLIHERFVFSAAFPPFGVTVDVSAPADARKWSHVAGVFDGKTVELYVDGALRDCRGLCVDERLPGDVLVPSDRRVAVGGHPTFEGAIDEVALYNAALTDSEIGSLAGAAKDVYFGADSSANPERGDFFEAKGHGYDFYGGRLITGLTKTRLQHQGHDVVDWTEVPTHLQEGGFEYDAALVARPERTYGFSIVVGPGHSSAARYRSNLHLFGTRQAFELAEQWREYEHLVGGRTLFADVERGCCKDCEPCNAANDAYGWRDCPAYDVDAEVIPDGCRQNQRILEGFLRAVTLMGESLEAQGDQPVRPGVYTRPNIWDDFFGKPFVPRWLSGDPIPFVLWLTGCESIDDRCETTEGVDRLDWRTADEVKADLATAEEQSLGGMRTVIWQHHINKPDWDAMRPNPSENFAPEPDWIRFSYFYSFGDVAGSTRVIPGTTFTIWDRPWFDSEFNDVAECRTNALGQIRAYNHDRLSEEGPGALGPWVSEDCSEAWDFGYVVRCCVLPPAPIVEGQYAGAAPIAEPSLQARALAGAAASVNFRVRDGVVGGDSRVWLQRDRGVAKAEKKRYSIF
jgi:hypothetical protein